MTFESNKTAIGKAWPGKPLWPDFGGNAKDAQTTGWGWHDAKGKSQNQDSYSVAFTAGDDSLTGSSPNYSKYPYRVTLVSTGASIDPTNTQSKATHKVCVVVLRRIPRKLATGPSDLATIVNYTWYQNQNDTFEFQVPVHVKGKSRIEGRSI